MNDYTAKIFFKKEYRKHYIFVLAKEILYNKLYVDIYKRIKKISIL